MNNENWFEYEWKLRGAPAQFHVDLQFLPKPEILGTRNHLLCLSYSAQKSASLLHGASVRSVLRKVRNILGTSSVFAGYIELSSSCWYYYYTSDPRLLVPVCDMLSAVRSASWNCTVEEEPSHDTYYRILCPNSAKWQSHNNSVYIDSLKKRGDDLNQPRRISLHLCLPSLRKTDPFFEEAKACGFAIGEVKCNDAYQLPYSVVLHVISPVSQDSLTELTTKAIRLAERHSGVFARLDSEFVPKRR